jgi:hypothetical protein
MLDRIVVFGVDTAERPAIGQVPPDVEPGDERLAVGAACSPLPGRRLGEQRTGVRTVVRSRRVFVLSPEILQNYPEKWSGEARREADAIRQI